MRDAHDRYANLEVNYLLQRVETFTGLVILATNRQSALDDAFLRRLRFVVRFEAPDRGARRALWRRAFPPEARLEEVDWEALAGPELTGANIQGVALAAAYLAAANGGAVERRAPGARAPPRAREDRPGLARHPAGRRPVSDRRTRVPRIEVRVSAPPRPGLVRPAIAAPPGGPRVRPGPGGRGRGRGRPRRRRRQGAEGAMALIKGILASFADPLLGGIPTLVLFQYNPTEVTRVFRVEGGGDGRGGRRRALNAVRPAPEDYTLKLEFDATDGLERGGPLTTAFGISPRLAALEMLMQPVGSSLLGDLAGALLGGRLGRRGHRAAGAAAAHPLHLGPEPHHPRPAHVAHDPETAFDELLNPIHASADLGFTVLRVDDLGADDTFARAAATYYQGAREVKAVLQLAQLVELA